MTLTKIAQMAKTSVSTVSKAFSGSTEISEETREKIFEIAKDLGCFDKYYKGPRKNPLVAIMIPEIESEYYALCAGIFEREFHKRNTDTIVTCTRFDPEREARLFRELAYGMRVDGILAWCSSAHIKNPDEIPLVVFGTSATASNSDSIQTDFYGALLDLMKTVKEYGHTSVGFIGERLTLTKEITFKKAMRSVGLPIYQKYMFVSNSRFAKVGEEGMRALIERGDVPSVIVAAYDQIAFGAMKYASDAGYRIPDDISFVGMDDISATSYFDVPLSSIHIEYEDVCEQIVELIFKRIDNRHYRSRKKISVPVSVKIRGSLKNLNG